MTVEQANSFLTMLTEGKEIQGVNTSLALNLIPLAKELGRDELVLELLSIAKREASSTSETAWSLFEQLKYDHGEAEQFFELAIQYESDESMGPFVAAVYHHVGLLHLSNARFDDAHTIALRALRFREKNGDPTGLRYGLQLLCTVCKRLNDSQGALAYATRILEAAIRDANDEQKMEAYADIGHIQATVGSFDAAKDALQHSLELANDLDDVSGLLVASWGLADIAEIHEQYEQAMILLSTCVQEFMSRQQPAPQALLARIEALTTLNQGPSSS
jgi:tetratricopeptide (TPR) repeat protein